MCASSSRSALSGEPAASASRLVSITDLIGASELLSSCQITRISRRHARRSSSRSAWDRSVTTSSRNGLPASWNTSRITCQRPARPGNVCDSLETGGPSSSVVESDLGRRQPDQRVRVTPQQFARRAVHEADPLVAVEGEHRDVDLGQHLVEERGGLDRLEPLRAQRRAEPVRLEHDVAERVALAAVPAADRVVAAAQRLQQVRDRAQRLDGRLVHGDREADPGADQEHDDEPVHRVREGRVAQQQESGQERRAGRPQA